MKSRLACVALLVMVTCPVDAHAQAGTPPEPSAAAPTARAAVSGKSALLAGGDPGEVEAYLSGLKREIESLRDRYRESDGGDTELDALDQRIDDAQKRYEDERDRLWPDETELNSPAMLVVGTVLGGLGVVGGATIGIIASYAPSEELILPGMVVGSIAGLGFLIGVPLIAAGAYPIPREASGDVGGVSSVSLQIGAGGVALAGSF